MKGKGLEADITTNPLLKKLIDLALGEDLGEVGDITTKAVIPEPSFCRSQIKANSEGILAGGPICPMVYEALDPRISVSFFKNDGEEVAPGDALIGLSGSTAAILTGERIALNFLQHLSGIATFCRQFVEQVEGTGVLVYDTRKTLPGLRIAEKYAVRVGGGFNHRFGLFDGILIKDNHLSVAHNLQKAVEAAKKEGLVEVEVEDLKQLDEALQAGADIILLDNMDIETLKRAVDRTARRAVLEASGGIKLENVRAIAETGVDRISIGAITQEAKPLDMALDIISISKEPV